MSYYEDKLPTCLTCGKLITDPKRLKNPIDQFCSEECYKKYLKKIDDEKKDLL